jgi:hypothetical protein
MWFFNNINHVYIKTYLKILKHTHIYIYIYAKLVANQRVIQRINCTNNETTIAARLTSSLLFHPNARHLASRALGHKGSRIHPQMVKDQPGRQKVMHPLSQYIYICVCVYISRNPRQKVTSSRWCPQFGGPQLPSHRRLLGRNHSWTIRGQPGVDTRRAAARSCQDGYGYPGILGTPK